MDVRLYFASRSGDFDSAMELLASGASVRYRDPWDDMTPLMVAAYRGHVHLVVLLLGKGASAMTRNRDGTTPLHFAAGFGNAEMCRVLMADGGAVPFAPNAHGETPRDWAVENGRTLVVEVLDTEYSVQSMFGSDRLARVRLVITLKQQIRLWRAYRKPVVEESTKIAPRPKVPASPKKVAKELAEKKEDFKRWVTDTELALKKR